MNKDNTSDMVIIIDTREQTPLFSKLPKGQIFVRDTLKVGDYSLRGFEENISLERKNPDDFLSSITTDRERFSRELEILKDYDVKLIVVEAELSKILAKCQPAKSNKKVVSTRKGVRSVFSGTRKIHPNSVLGAITAIEDDYGIPIYFALNRTDAERRVLASLKRFYTRMREG